MPNSWQARDISRFEEIDPVVEVNLLVHVCAGNASDDVSFALLEQSERNAYDG